MRSLRYSFSLLLLVAFCTAGLASAADFAIGNLNPPVGESLPGIVTGMTAFGYLVYPPEQAVCSEQGFYMENIRMLLEFTPDMMAMSFLMSAALYTAELDPNDGMLKPGVIICLAQDLSYTVAVPGLQEMVLPFNPCVPVQLDDHYFLVISYNTPMEAYLPVDGLPEPGVVFMDRGLGWFDMFSGLKTPAGKSIIWGDITCGVPPIGVEGGRWGEIKGMYR